MGTTPRWGHAVAAILTIILGAAPTASADDPTFAVDATIQVQGDATIRGSWALEAVWAGIIHPPHQALGPASFTVSAHEATLKLVNERMYDVYDGEGNIVMSTESPPQTVDERTGWTGTLTLESGTGDYRILPRQRADDPTVFVDGVGELSLTPKDPFAAWHRAANEHRVAAKAVPDGAGTRFRVGELDQGLVHDVGTVVAFGGTVTLGRAQSTESWDTGTFEATQAGDDLPARGATVKVWDQRYLIVTGGRLSATLGGQGDEAWTVLAQTVTGTWTGDAEFTHTQAEWTTPDVEIPPAPSHLQLIGTFTTHADYAHDNSHNATWTLDGQATMLAADGYVVAGQRPTSHTLSTAEIAAGVTALVLLAWVARWGYHAIAALVLRSRTPEDVLRHPLRRAIVRWLTVHACAKRSDLVKSLGTNVGTLRFHIRILQRAGLVRRIRDGYRDATYALEHASRASTQTLNNGEAKQTRDDVANALLSRPHLRHVHDAVKALGAPDATQIAEHLGAKHDRQIHPSTASRHAKRLVHAGILQQARDGRRVVWRAQDTTPTQPDASPLDAFLRYERLDDVFRILASRAPSSRDALDADLREGGAHGSRLKRLGQDLRRLESFGLVRRERNHYATNLDDLETPT